MEYPKYPPHPSEEEEAFINNTIIDWSLANGLAMLTPEGKGTTAVHAPVTVYPSPFPKSGFETALAVQKAFNQLYARVSDRTKWLKKALEEYVFYIQERISLQLALSYFFLFFVFYLTFSFNFV